MVRHALTGKVRNINLYKVNCTYNLPYESEVAVLAENPEQAVHRVRTAVDADNMDPEMKFEIHSCELVEENVEVNEEEVHEDYKAYDKRILN